MGIAKATATPTHPTLPAMTLLVVINTNIGHKAAPPLQHPHHGAQTAHATPRASHNNHALMRLATLMLSKAPTMKCTATSSVAPKTNVTVATSSKL